MNKIAIKNFAIWARNKLIADISYKAGLMGITEAGIKAALPQSTKDVEFYDIGTKEPYAITGVAVRQRAHLAELIRTKAACGDYETAYRSVVEEVAYTWFNRLIAVRFMEVNDYLPSHIRALSSENADKLEPDLVTTPFDSDLDLSDYEKAEILRMKNDNLMDELFRMLFIKQCNKLGDILPKLFEKTVDYSELLLNVSVTDKDGVVFRLVHDIPEDDFNIEKGGQVEIIGWLYQYYNTEPKDKVFADLKKNIKISKETIPAATQLFTPDWIVRYMVENSLGRLWIEHELAGQLSNATLGDMQGITLAELQGRRLGPVTEGQLAKNYGWKYYLEEAEQEPEVKTQLEKLRADRKDLKPEDIKIIDPCMGSGHILVYAFDVLMQIYESAGYALRDAAKSILENNLYGLDIDDRAAQLAYFAVMMKARQYDRRFFSSGIQPHVHSIIETSTLGGSYKLAMGDFLLSKEHQETLNYLLHAFIDAKEYGSILQLENRDYEGLMEAWKYASSQTVGNVTMSLWYSAVEHEIPKLIEQAIMLEQKYDVVATNPPYRALADCSEKLCSFAKKYYPYSKNDLSTIFMERTLDMCKHTGFMAMINIPVWMSKASFESLRHMLLVEHTFFNMLHCGRGIFGSDFGTTSFVIGKCFINSYIAVFHKLFNELGSVDSVEQKELWFHQRKGYYEVQQQKFLKIASYPIAYSTSKKLLNILDNEKPLSEYAYPRKGLTTGDNDTFVRLWFEVSKKKSSMLSKGTKWFPMTKGGDFRKWYGNNEYVVNWENDGYEIKHFKDEKGKLRSRPQNTQFYFQEGISWNDTTATGKIAFRYQSDGYISNASGPCVFADHDLIYLFGLLNSSVSQKLLEILAPNMKFEVGQMALVPTIIKRDAEIERLVKKTVALAKCDWDSFETSWDFKCHPLISNIRFEALWGDRTDEEYRSVGSIEMSFTAWVNICERRFNELKANEEELNRIFIEIYGLQDELIPDVDDKDVTVRKAELGRDIRSLISYAVGCMFGRYSLNVGGLAYAGGDWDEKYIKTGGLYPSDKLFPSDSLYPSAPQITHIRVDGQDVPLAFAPDADNCIPITDEEYFSDDIVDRFVEFIRIVYGTMTLEENLDFIAKALGNKGSTSREVIRNYFLNDFFKNHCQIYQKRPIYWLFDSGKQNGFKALVYMHRYDENTIGNLRVDYLHRMERVYESELARMQDVIDKSSDSREVSAATKRKEKLQKQLKECREYDEKIAHLALARIPIDLDDGVKVNYEKVQTVDGKKYEVLAKI